MSLSLVAAVLRHDPEDVRRIAEEVLSRPEFAEPEPSIFERAQRWAAELLQRLLEALTGTANGLLGLLFLAGVGVLVVILARRGWRSVQADPGVAPRGNVQVSRPRTPDEWRRDAAEHEKAGRWRQALRCRYRALVGDLAGAGVLDDVPGRTTGEERELVRRSAPAASRSFEEATELFDRAWYGDAPTGPDEHGRFTRLADDVLAGTRP